jgi:hypothetical protein
VRCVGVGCVSVGCVSSGAEGATVPQLGACSVLWRRLSGQIHQRISFVQLCNRGS